MTARLIDFLRQLERRDWSYESYLRTQRRIAGVPRNPQQALPPDDWQEFKRRCVDTIGGETVRSDGLTHREFIEYLRTSHRDYEWDDDE